MKAFKLPAVLVAALFLGMGAAQLCASADNKTNAAPNRPVDKTNPGERVFAANCSRCHTPPMSISPRTTGTVIMHMRVRARLSREDEKLLLKYLAP